MVAAALAFIVVVIGAYVRLSDAGLGCPDWPGCYGKLLGVPESEAAVRAANQTFPERAVEAPKAWKEMIHRYFAGALGLLILAIMLLAVRNRRTPGQPLALPLALVVLVIFQALLGMWTVTLKLKPVVVMAHLLGGFATLSLLAWLALSTRESSSRTLAALRSYRPWVVGATIILVAQIALGGWTSANYAALACPDFPTCQSQWWPEMDFAEAFVLWRGLGVNYEFGVLDHPARTAIHVVHRLGAVITVVYLSLLGFSLLLNANAPRTMRGVSALMLVLLGAQISLGISNVIFKLPLPMAVAHNGIAAVLLLAVLSLSYMLPARGECLSLTRERV